MTGLRLRSARVAWLWCLAYTVAVGPELRHRRREEIRGHLWEAEAAGVRAHRLLSATVRGLLDDVSWSLRRGWRWTVGQPETWLAAAAAMPIFAWIGAMVSPSRGNGVDLAGGLGGPSLLAVAGVAWLLRRRRG